jgi:hypothetical protein
MLSKCANPACSKAFLYLHTGRLFLLEVAKDPENPQSQTTGRANTLPVRRLEYFWLCAKCCEELTLTTDRSGKLLMVRVAARKAS